VVDDGSVDNTRDVAHHFHEVVYLYQTNQGLSASRNTGIDKSKGDYLIFLDADDLLYPDAVKINLSYLQQAPEVAFVSGAHDKVYTGLKIKEEKIRDIKHDHYIELLQGNYIAMIASVLFRRNAFNEFKYDTSLKACEDYDIFLKISRKFPVMHHTQKVAVYNIYSANMSSNIPLMLNSALKVLKRQRKFLKNIEEKNAYSKGLDVWKKYFCNEIVQKLKAQKIKPTFPVLLTLLKYQPRSLMKYCFTLR
jgi:glycosyltransferase involved in cell wall biosynthesis